MRKTHLPLFLAILTFGLINFIPINSCLAQKTLNQDEISIYSSLLLQRSNGAELVIKNITVADNININKPDSAEYYMSHLPPLSKETLDDYSARNSNPVKFKSKFNLKSKVNFVGKEINQIFTNDPKQVPKGYSWEVFKEKYPTANGFITLSRVGFNKEKTQAFAYIGHYCEGLCGSGWYYFLLKRDDEWTVEKGFNAWVS